MTAPLPKNEAERLRALQRYQILETLPEAAFEDITRLASQICQTPMALISLVDENRQWFKSHHGLSLEETERELSFCAHALLSPRETMVVPDTVADKRFMENGLVMGSPHLRFYAGAPLITPGGHALGTLCVLDRVPRQLSLEQVAALESLSRHTMRLFDARIEAEKLRAANERLTQLSQTDALTGLHNRRWFQKRLAHLWGEAQRKNEPLSLLLLDLDGFKAYNDTHGHLAGDVLLKVAARTLQKHCRPHSGDGAARFGGDEMVLLLPRTNACDALHIAEKLQKSFPALPLEAASALRTMGATVPLSFSAGVATFLPKSANEPESRFDDFIRAADEALYSAKRGGKNRVGVAAFGAGPN